MKLFKTPLQAIVTLYLIAFFIIMGNGFFLIKHIHQGLHWGAGVSAFGLICGLIMLVDVFRKVRKLC